MHIMGKQDSKPQEVSSVDQLLSSIREAIESETGNDIAVPAKVPLKPIGAPPAPRFQIVSSDVSKPVEVSPDAKSAAMAVSDGDVMPGPGYVSANPYRYRHSLETSPSYMSLRNRLASLKSRTRSSTSRSMANLLGGDVRQEEARAREQQQQLHQHETAEPSADAETETGLRSSLSNEQAYVDEFITGDMSSGVVSYTPDYSDWSLENPLDGVAKSEPDAPEPVVTAALATRTQVIMEEARDVSIEPEDAVEVSHDETTTVTDTVDTDPVDTDPVDEVPEQAGLPLEEMIRQVIEPELVIWIDRHLPDQVAAAMPDEEAFTAMIRPMIEQWLADNLSPIVEVAVREEIARITGLKR